MKKVSKSINRFFAFIISLLGFSSACNDEEIVCLYGVPPSNYDKNYIFEGTVKSNDSLNLIPDIEVQLFMDSFSLGDAITNHEGYYKIISSSERSGFYRISYTDVDSSKNGKFKNFDTVIDFNSYDTSSLFNETENGTISKIVNVRLERFEKD